MIIFKINKEIANPKGFILITSIVLMFVCSSIIFAYFMQISHEYQRVEVNIAQAKAKYNARSGLAYEAYEKMFLRHFIDTLDTGELKDSIRYFAGSKELDMDHDWFNCPPDGRSSECMGDYDSISVRIRETESGRLVRYGYALGFATYKNIFGKILTLTDSVDITTKFLPTLNTYMYLTADESAGGAPQTMNNGERSGVTFGANDNFGGGSNGNFQSNGTMEMSSYGCPTFTETVTVTRNCDGTVNSPILGSCNFNSVFQGDPQLDTASAVCLPPPSFEQKKQFADYIFDAEELLVSDGLSYPGGLQRDTLIMTELEFLENGGGGFRVSRYKYLMPPHLDEYYATEAGSPDLANNGSDTLSGDFLETNGYWGSTCSTTNISYVNNSLCNNNC